jgi:phosphatidylinositol alpha-1,6-mannosyltransferase
VTNVLLVTPDYPPMAGGIATLLRSLADGAKRCRFEVLALESGRPAAPFDPQGAPVIRAPSMRDHRASVARLNAHALAHAWRRRPDVIVSGHVVAGPGAVAARALIGVAVVQYVYGKELAQRHRLARRILPRCDATIAVSRHAAATARRAGAPGARLHVVHPGVDEPGVAAPDAGPRTCDIVTVARLEERYKGFDVMLRALPLVIARVPAARWVVVGDGALRADIQETATAWGLADRVLLLGAVNDAERDRRLREAAVFAMPSRVPPHGGGEGFGIVYLEAGRHRTPVVAGGEGGALDAVVHGQTGTLVDPRDHVALADALIELLTDDERAARLGAAGEDRARALSWASMIDQVEEIIVGVTRRGGR